MIVPLRASEHTYDFHKPVASAVLTLYDPELRLVFNRKHECFQVMRIRTRQFRVEIDGLGPVSFLNPVLVHITDWSEGLYGRDDPWPLIERLEESDTLKHPNLSRDRVEQVRAQKEKQDRSIDDMWKYQTRSNMRQLRRVWQPFADYSGFVR